MDTVRSQLAAAPLIALLAASGAHAQSFDSRSNGSDGALNITGAPRTVVFDPAAMGLDADGDNVFHFTTITVASGITLTFPADKLKFSPVYWLATGDVNIQGILDLDGKQGYAGGAQADARNAMPGPGGYHGGVGGAGPTSGAISQAGFGPVPGAASTSTGGNGGNNSTPYLIPLAGGSGGGGAGSYTTAYYGAGGGGGGGAMLIASSTLVRIDGQIHAVGGLSGANGSGYNAGRGGGGSIRILAPSVQGAGTVSTAPNGAVRIETFGAPFAGTVTSAATLYRAVTLSSAATFLPSAAGAFPRLSFVRIAGANAPATPEGSFLTPDMSINVSTPIAIDVGAANIPPGIVVKLKVHNETQVVAEVSTSPLVGTLASSTATATVTLPPGFSRLFISATW